MKLAGKVAFITGTSPNIGGGIAEGLADEGAKVVCVDVSADYANHCAESIVKRGGQAIGVECDVTNEDSGAKRRRTGSTGVRRHRHSGERGRHL